MTEVLLLLIALLLALLILQLWRSGRGEDGQSRPTLNTRNDR